MSRLPHSLNDRPANAGCSLYHSVMSCLRFWGPNLATSVGAYGCSRRMSCSRVAHFNVWNFLGFLGVKSHITCMAKISRKDNELGTSKGS